VPEWRVITRHVMRNALIPLVTVIALNIGAVPLSCGSALVQAEGDADDCVDVLLP
jgi:ABC-type dipeptide/oligopeptide/nickel transport system permease component